MDLEDRLRRQRHYFRISLAISLAKHMTKVLEFLDLRLKALSDREIGLGVVNPRTEEPESVEEIVAKAELALQYYKPEQMFLNPDCGFACFANRCVNEEDVAVKKIHRIAEAAAVLREKYA